MSTNTPVMWWWGWIVLISIVFACGCGDDARVDDDADTASVATDSEVARDSVDVVDTQPPSDQDGLALDEIPTDADIVDADLSPLDPATRTVHLESSAVAMELGASQVITGYAVGDVDGDGYEDLVAIAGDELIIVRRDARTSARPPLAFDAPHRRTLGFSARFVKLGDMDGTGRLDIVVYEPVAGMVGVLLNAGGSMASAFEGPLVILDAHEVAFSDPALARDDSWAVADVDGDGSDDAAFAVAEKGVWVGYVGPGSELASAVLEVTFLAPPGPANLAAAARAIPTQLLALDLDGSPSQDLAIGFSGTEGVDDEVALFVSRSDRTFADPVRASDVVVGSVGKGLAAMATADLNEDGLPDLVWAAQGGPTTHAGLWLSDASTPITNTSPFTKTIPIETRGLSVGRFLVEPDTGSAGTGPDALEQLDYLSHVVMHASTDGNCALIPITRSGLGQITEVVAQRPFSGGGVDLDGDGFLEFVAHHGQDLDLVYQQRILYADYAADVYVQADGATKPLCEMIAPQCALGALGLCEMTRTTCSGCSASERFATTYRAQFYDLYEASEQTCDGLDNDCDGLTDVLSTHALHLAPLAQDLADHHMFGTARGMEMVIVPPTPGAAVLHLVVDDPVTPANLAPTAMQVLTDPAFTVHSAANDVSVAVLGHKAADVAAFSVMDSANNESVATVAIPDAEAATAKPVYAFGEWFVVWDRPTTAPVGTELVGAAPLSNSAFASGPLAPQRTLAAYGTTNRLHTLGSSGAGIVVQSFDAAGAPTRPSVEVLAARGVLLDQAFDGDTTRQCLAVADGLVARTRVALATTAVTTATTDVLVLVAPAVELPIEQLVPGSLRTVLEPGGCRFTWLAGTAGVTGQLILRDAFVDLLGQLVARRDLGVVRAGDAAAPRTHLTTAFGKTYATTVSDAATMTLQTYPICQGM